MVSTSVVVTECLSHRIFLVLKYCCTDFLGIFDYNITAYILNSLKVTANPTKYFLLQIRIHYCFHILLEGERKKEVEKLGYFL